MRSRRLLQHYDAHKGCISGLDFHVSGDFLASCGEDEFLKIWDLREGRLLYKVTGHQKAPSACAFSPSGNCLVTGGKDNLVFVWGCSSDGQELPVSEAPSPARRTSLRTSSNTKPKEVRDLQVRPSSGGPLLLGNPDTPPRSLPARINTSTPKQHPPLTPEGQKNQAIASQQESIVPDTALRGVTSAELPQPLAQTLRTMQNHLEIMARTVQLLDQRLALNEQQVTEMRKMLLPQQQTQCLPPT